MPRLFVALDLPDSVKRSLEPLAKGLGDVRWSTPDQQHLTLRFIGEVGNGAVPEVVEALATVPAMPFALTLEGLGHFPPRGEPRVLWVGVQKSAELARLKRRIDRALEQAGIPPDGRKFAPHVTLARFREPPLPDRFGSWVARRSLFRTQPFPFLLEKPGPRIASPSVCGFFPAGSPNCSSSRFQMAVTFSAVVRSELAIFRASK